MTEYQHHRGIINGINTHFVTLGGGGRPLVLLHGYPLSWYCWNAAMPVLAEAEYYCIAPDLRGLGDTGRPPGGYDKKTIAGDVYELVRNHLGI